MYDIDQHEREKREHGIIVGVGKVAQKKNRRVNVAEQSCISWIKKCTDLYRKFGKAEARKSS